MKNGRTRVVVVAGAVAGSLFGTTLALGADAFWQGPDGGLFGVSSNWSIQDIPDANDIAINLIGGDIQFDMQSGWAFPFNPYIVQGFSAATNGGSFTMRSLAPVNPQHSYMHSTGAVNYPDWQTKPPYVIKVGHDAFTIGASAPGQPVANVGTFGFDWEITPQDVNANVLVAGTVGPGKWLAQGGSGFSWVNLGYWICPNGFGQILDANGIPVDGNIDSQVTSEVFFPGRSTWTFHGVKFCANRCINLDFWYANRDGVPGLHNFLHVFEYFEARMLFYEGIDGSGEDSDTMQVDFKSAASPSGLRVLQFVGLSGTNPTGNDGPWIEAGEMLVKRQAPTDAPAVVRIEDASHLHVTIDLSDRDPQVVSPRFEDASILQYGTKHGLLEETQDPWITTHRNHFLVLSKQLATPGALTLDPTSMMTALGASVGQDPYVPGSHDLLHQMDNSHFVIQSQVSELPARGWHTGDVDLFFRTDFADQLDFEVIAEDVCNLWFVDVPEPRCTKHWRNLVVDGPAPLLLVDDYNNHICQDTGDDALYVLDDIFLRNRSTFDVNGTQVYYGGSLNRDDGTAIVGLPAPIQLKKTLYGDFNGDCLVDAGDVAIISNYVSGIGPKCDWPLGDWDGDCTVDAIDLTEVMLRAGDLNFQPLPGCQAGGTNCSILQAPAGGGGGGPLFASSETISAFSDATVVFIASQVPVSDQEKSDMTAAVSALA